MPPVNARPLLRLGAACVVLVAAMWVLFGRGGGSDEVGTLDVTTTQATPPERFGPIRDDGTGVVRTESGLTLPVTGGEDGTWRVLTPCANPATVEGDRLTGAHVVLDPGHGGEETGAIGPSGVVEAELNLDVARRAAELLEDHGATVVLTRDTDTRVSIETRAAVVRALDPRLFVSIHHNGGPTTAVDRPGVQVFHQHETPPSARLAGLLFEALQAGFAPFAGTWSGGNSTGVRARLGSEATDFYGILRDTSGVPGVLAEALYLSSEPEASLLLEPDVRRAEAEAIAAAILTWFDTGRAGTGYLPPLRATESAGGGGGTAGCDDPAELAGG